MSKKKLDLSSSSVESEDLDSDSKGPEDSSAFGLTTSIDTPAKSTEQDSEPENLEKEISETSQPIQFLNMSFLLEASPAKVFPLLESVRVSRTEQKELFSTKSAGSLEIKDQASYSLRMLKDYFLTTEAEPSLLYSFRWMNLGMMSSGRCLILNAIFPKAANVSLSSVLEEKVDPKYYLSEKTLRRMANWNSLENPLRDHLHSKEDICGTIRAADAHLHGGAKLIKEEE